MLSAATRSTGQSVATPDTCNTPTGTGVDVPTPYVNTASNTQAINFATTVLIECGNALTQKASVPTTSGDESGTSHPVTKQEARYTTGSSSVFIEQSPAVTFASLSTGNAMNASSGLVAVQSAATVYFTQREGVGAGIPAPGAALGADELGALARSITCGTGVVDAHEDADGTLHVRIARFTEDVGTAVARVLAHAPHATRVVLDLRGNPGGDLDAALALASDFLDEGTPLAIVRDADGDEELRRAHGPKRNAHSLTLWVDGGTASAAEVFTMALDASGRARVLGERTYGKASVQRSITGPDGRAAYAVVAEVCGPDGRRFAGTGIDPDRARPPETPG